jgi:hypothetical protein
LPADEVFVLDAGVDAPPFPEIAPRIWPSVCWRFSGAVFAVLEPPPLEPPPAEPVAPPPPDAVEAVLVTVRLLLLVRVALAAPAVLSAAASLHALVEGPLVPGIAPPGSGTHARGFDGSVSLTPGWLGPSHE